MVGGIYRHGETSTHHLCPRIVDRSIHPSVRPSVSVSTTYRRDRHQRVPPRTGPLRSHPLQQGPVPEELWRSPAKEVVAPGGFPWPWLVSVSFVSPHNDNDDDHDDNDDVVPVSPRENGRPVSSLSSRPEGFVRWFPRIFNLSRTHARTHAHTHTGAYTNWNTYLNARPGNYGTFAFGIAIDDRRLPNTSA